MPETTFDELVNKYVEMNIAHPFMERQWQKCENLAGFDAEKTPHQPKSATAKCF